MTEKTIAQLKSGLAFHTVPTMAYAANSAWQQLVILTHKPADELSDRDRRSTSRSILQVHHVARVTNDPDTALHAFPSRRSTGAPRGPIVTATRKQPRRAAAL